MSYYACKIAYELFFFSVSMYCCSFAPGSEEDENETSEYLAGNVGNSYINFKIKYISITIVIVEF